MKFNGEGIQHVALLTDDIFATIDKLALAGVPLMTAPNDVYYEMLDERLPGHGQPVAELKTRGILLDGTTAAAGPPQGGELPPRGADAAGGVGAGPPQGKPRLLLQIFSEALLG